MLFINYCKKVLTGFLFFISFFIFSISCDSTKPPANISLTLKLEDASCTQAWLQLPATINLLKNNSVTQTFSLSTQDSLLYIDSLLPNQNYSFQISSIQNPVSSNKVSVTTLDTTSHNFSWQTFTFGQHSSSTLYDVTIIDENNIWAVGEIYVADTSINGYTTYNAVHWDGSEWELKRIPFTGSCSAVMYPPIRTILAFSDSDIWFARGGSLVHFDGQNYFNDCGMNSFLTGSINKIWGSSSNDLYIVGNEGNIAHYQNGSWTKIESGVDTDLKDISGTTNGKEIWTCGWSNSTGRVSLLKINNSNVESLWDSQTNTTLNIYRGTFLNSLFANGNSEFVLVGGQVLRHSAFYKNQVKLEWVETYNGSKVL